MSPEVLQVDMLGAPVLVGCAVSANNSWQHHRSNHHCCKRAGQMMQENSRLCIGNFEARSELVVCTM